MIDFLVFFFEELYCPSNLLFYDNSAKIHSQKRVLASLVFNANLLFFYHRKIGINNYFSLDLNFLFAKYFPIIIPNNPNKRSTFVIPAVKSI